MPNDSPWEYGGEWSRNRSKVEYEVIFFNSDEVEYASDLYFGKNDSATANGTLTVPIPSGYDGTCVDKLSYLDSEGYEQEGSVATATDTTITVDIPVTNGYGEIDVNYYSEALGNNTPSGSDVTPDAYVIVNGQKIELSTSVDFSFNEAQANTVEATLLSKFEGDWQNLSDEEYEAQSERVLKQFILEQTGVVADRVEIANMIDISNTASIDLSAGVPITFKAAGICAGDMIVVLHLTTAGQWENIPATADNGVITGTFTSLSPVFYAKVTTAVGSDNHTHSYAATVVEPTAICRLLRQCLRLQHWQEYQ